jgi:hypothetical protein
MISEEYKTKLFIRMIFKQPNVVETLSFPNSSAYTPDILSDKCCLNIILRLS